MSKYSSEFKLEVVKYFIEQHHGYKDASKYFGIPSHENIRHWCKKYELYGLEGILKNLKSSYDGEFKQNVVEYMHTNHLSAAETAIQFRFGNVNRVLKSKLYYIKEKEYKNIEELEKDIIEYIEYYNNGRIKSKLKGMSTCSIQRTFHVSSIIYTVQLFGFGTKGSYFYFKTS